MIHLAGFFRLVRLTFVDKELRHGDVYSLRFKASKPIKHIAGQHAAFLARRGRPHIFSLASAPEEDYVMIATHLREGSPFKQALAALRPGDHITMVGPALNFTLEGAPDHVVFLAQGVGVTPLRSMLVHNARSASRRHITLIHADGLEPTFCDETQSLADESHYPDSPEMFQSMLERTVADNPQAWFYISGSPSFIKQTKDFLVTNQIPKSQLKSDGFLGYK
jgi:glycine betaine catabolism B